MKPTGNTILITGAGSGIGRELARRFHDLGNTVLVAGRRTAALEETIGGRDRMYAVPLNVEDAGAIAATIRQIRAEYPDLNVLVNNAGIMRREDLTKTSDLWDAEQTILTNLLGPIRLINALVEHLSGRPNAAIVNVSSGLAFTPLSHTPTYNATKAAIHSWTVSLREQLKGKVEVIELVPPAVQTELTAGQPKNDSYMPLDAFIDETMALFKQQPTPKEILVQRVAPLRFSERDGRFDEMVQALGAF